MKKKVFALSCYVAAISLFLFYIAVLRMSMETDVSLEYTMFYIDDKLAYYLEDDGLKNYGVGKEFSYVTDGTYRNQGKGWGAIAQEGTWSVGPKSYIYFYIKEEKEPGDGYELNIQTSESVGKTVEVVVNGKSAGENQVAADGMFCIGLPEKFFHKGANEVLLQTGAEDMTPYLLVKTVKLKENKVERTIGKDR